MKFKQISYFVIALQLTTRQLMWVTRKILSINTQCFGLEINNLLDPNADLRCAHVRNPTFFFHNAARKHTN